MFSSLEEKYQFGSVDQYHSGSKEELEGNSDRSVIVPVLVRG